MLMMIPVTEGAGGYGVLQAEDYNFHLEHARFDCGFAKPLIAHSERVTASKAEAVEEFMRLMRLLCALQSKLPPPPHTPHPQSNQVSRSVSAFACRLSLLL